MTKRYDIVTRDPSLPGVVRKTGYGRVQASQALAIVRRRYEDSYVVAAGTLPPGW